jgi:hypothetical protein
MVSRRISTTKRGEKHLTDGKGDSKMKKKPIKKQRNIVRHLRRNDMKERTPLAQVEMDQAQLDLFLIDRETGEPFGWPQLTMATDEVTRGVVSMDISLDPPACREHRRQ